MDNNQDNNQIDTNNSSTKPKRIPWNKGLTAETCETIALAQKKKEQTNLARYGVPNVFQIEEIQARLSEDRHSGKFAAKAMQTKELRYGDKNYNNVEQEKLTKLERYGSETYNNREKAKKTCLEKYGTEHPNQNKEQAQKISQSRILNNSQEKAWATIIQNYGSIENYFQQMYLKMEEAGTIGNRESSCEKKMYAELCEIYGADDIIHPYYDKDRYPFKCDFYIISEDKFIELHSHFTHGTHPFDETNPEDLELLEQLKNSDKRWAKSFIYTWTDLDVRKLQTALKNNLNFEAIYNYK